MLWGIELTFSMAWYATFMQALQKKEDVYIYVYI